MRDRLLFFGGIGAVLLALVATLFVLGPAAAARTPAPAAAVEPTPVPTPDPERDNVQVVVHLDGLPGDRAGALAGDRVDVLAFFPASVSGGPAMTRRLLSNVAVVGEAGGAPDPTSVTLSVARDAVPLVRYAEGLKAHLFLVLRDPTNADASAQPPTAAGATDADLVQAVQRGLSGAR